eukprot:CAMPEP_0173468304 /NCGR_PEP_ID=MMETSP1357-20121228/76628_1 /TAXON_ID=77926 /ORGANISM="Hemiselmis rufescens, Strain PCC563" /LENGTH=33 /DNA_ID= /DNA_START= /DNA_END= /DNA_ORIENTATION=
MSVEEKTRVLLSPEMLILGPGKVSLKDVDARQM